jgi:hypothetical protein
VCFVKLQQLLSIGIHLQVAKIKQSMLGDSKDGGRPVVRTFYDHMQVSILLFRPSLAKALFSSCSVI